MKTCREGLALVLVLACGPGKDGETASAGSAGTTEGTTAGTTSTSTGNESVTAATTSTTTGETSGTTADVPMQCLAFGNGAAFGWDPRFLAEAGVASCTVLEPKPITLDCTGPLMGTFVLNLAGGFLPELAVDEAVEVDYRVEFHEEFLESWLRLRSGPATKLVLGQARTVAPPDAPPDWFPTNVEVGVADVGCPSIACDDGSGLSFTKQALTFGQGDDVITLEAAGTGQIPGRFGGETYMADVREARLGACGITAGDITSWYAFAIVRTAGP